MKLADYSARIVSADRVLPLLASVRSCGADRWIARCPAHEDRHPSLSIRHIDGRLLLKCWTGCTAAEIVAALGLTLSDLFDGHQYKPDFNALRQRRVIDGFRQWREPELMRCARELRARDALLLSLSEMVQAKTITETEAWPSLAHEYTGYSYLEYQFDVLRTGTDDEVMNAYE